MSDYSFNIMFSLLNHLCSGYLRTNAVYDSVLLKHLFARCEAAQTL